VFASHTLARCGPLRCGRCLIAPRVARLSSRRWKGEFDRTRRPVDRLAPPSFVIGEPFDGFPRALAARVHPRASPVRGRQRGSSRRRASCSYLRSSFPRGRGSPTRRGDVGGEGEGPAEAHGTRGVPADGDVNLGAREPAADLRAELDVRLTRQTRQVAAAHDVAGPQEGAVIRQGAGEGVARTREGPGLRHGRARNGLEHRPQADVTDRPLPRSGSRREEIKVERIGLVAASVIPIRLGHSNDHALAHRHRRARGTSEGDANRTHVLAVDRRSGPGGTRSGYQRIARLIRRSCGLREHVGRPAAREGQGVTLQRGAELEATAAALEGAGEGVAHSLSDEREGSLVEAQLARVPTLVALELERQPVARKGTREGLSLLVRRHWVRPLTHGKGSEQAERAEHDPERDGVHAV